MKWVVRTSCERDVVMCEGVTFERVFTCERGGSRVKRITTCELECGCAWSCFNGVWSCENRDGHM